jgi:hypothetical protein
VWNETESSNNNQTHCVLKSATSTKPESETFGTGFLCLPAFLPACLPVGVRAPRPVHCLALQCLGARTPPEGSPGGRQQAAAKQDGDEKPMNGRQQKQTVLSLHCTVKAFAQKHYKKRASS